MIRMAHGKYSDYSILLYSESSLEILHVAVRVSLLSLLISAFFVEIPHDRILMRMMLRFTKFKL